MTNPAKTTQFNPAGRDIFSSYAARGNRASPGPQCANRADRAPALTRQSTDAFYLLFKSPENDVKQTQPAVTAVVGITRKIVDPASTRTRPIPRARRECAKSTNWHPNCIHREFRSAS